jgi:hypothetical protein
MAASSHLWQCRRKGYCDACGEWLGSRRDEGRGPGVSSESWFQERGRSEEVGRLLRLVSGDKFALRCTVLEDIWTECAVSRRARRTWLVIKLMWRGAGCCNVGFDSESLKGFLSWPREKVRAVFPEGSSRDRLD